MRTNAKTAANMHKIVTEQLNNIFAGVPHLGPCAGAPPAGKCVDMSHIIRPYAKTFFARLFEYVGIEEHPILTGRFLAFFSQCAEDNAAVALIDYLTEKRKAGELGALNSVRVDWYSTFVSGVVAPSPTDNGVRHLDLCPVCKPVFAVRLKNAIKRVIIG